MTDRLSDSDRRQDVMLSRVMLGTFIEELPKLIQTLREMHAGYPTGHEGSSSPELCPTCDGATTLVGGLGLAELCPDCEGQGYVTDSFQSRTESAAFTPDKARKDLAEVDRLVRQVRNVADQLDSKRAEWLVPVERPKDSASKADAAKAEAGCVSCRRDKRQVRGEWRRWWEPTRELPKTKDEKKRYSDRCQFCDDWFRGEEQNPPMELLRWHHDNPGARLTTAILERLGIKTKTANARERRKKAS